jgi:hypothetical protein
MTDHWDDDFDFDTPEELPEPDQPGLPTDGPELSFDEPDLTVGEPDWELPEAAAEPEITEQEIADDAVFPPALDVGELPEPVDGFPWIDTATLGAPDPSGFTAPLEPVSADELAAYAGVEVPEGANAWEVLAADEDPATSALARWWTPGEQ